MQLRENASGAFGKGQTCGGGAHGMGAAAEQGAAQRTFQGIYAPGYRRRCQWMAARRCGKAASFQYVEKQIELLGQAIGVHHQVLLCGLCIAILRCYAFRS